MSEEESSTDKPKRSRRESPWVLKEKAMRDIVEAVTNKHPISLDFEQTEEAVLRLGMLLFTGAFDEARKCVSEFQNKAAEKYHGKNVREIPFHERLALPIGGSNLTIRTVNGLEKRGIYTFRDLLSLRQQDILDIDNFGEKTLQEVLSVVHEYGFDVA